MASPQRENGHVQIANELWEALCRCRIPGVARQCLDAIIRKTYGYNKKMDYISIRQISELTGISRPKVSRALNQLQSMNLIIKDTAKYINRLGINKNYDTWKVFPKMGTVINRSVPQSGNRSVPKNGNKSVPQGGNYKRHKDKKHIYMDSFEAFWKKYPKRNGKKLGKEETFNSLMNNVKLNELDVFMSALDNYINSDDVKKGFVKDPKRFIKNRDWTWRDWIEPAEEIADGENPFLRG